MLLRPGRLLALGALALVGLLYWKPVHAYMSTRQELHRQQAEVAARCPFGRPAVTEQAPYDESGAPFPTQFYVTCPHLVAQISRVEAAGGVERWTHAAESEPALALSLARAHDEQRALRPELPVG